MLGQPLLTPSLGAINQLARALGSTLELVPFPGLKTAA